MGSARQKEPSERRIRDLCTLTVRCQEKNESLETIAPLVRDALHNLPWIQTSPVSLLVFQPWLVGFTTLPRHSSCKDIAQIGVCFAVEACWCSALL